MNTFLTNLDSFSEKQTRGKVKAAVERLVSKDAVVIADSMNYIKGYRYELYCVARAMRTPHCVVYCDTPIDTVKEWNSKRPSQEQYDEKLLSELFTRMEVPNGNNRWDNPLFSLKLNDATPLQEISNAMLNPTHTLKPNVSTLPVC
jgi:protein KTI12